MFSTDTHSMVIDHQADALDHAADLHHQSRWEKDTRYYLLQLEQDLFGEWVLTRVWGRKQSALGQLRREPFDSYGQALARLGKEERRRQGRGYVRTI